LGSGGKTGRGETGTGSVSLWDGGAGGGGKTGGKRLGAGSVSNIGRDGNKDLRCMNKGIHFSTEAETAGTGSEQDEGDLAGRGKDTGEGQAEVNGALLRGEGSMGEGLMDGGAASTSIGMSGSERDAREISRRMGKNEGVPSKTDIAWGSCSEARGHVSGVLSRVDTGKGGGVLSETGRAQTSWLGGRSGGSGESGDRRAETGGESTIGRECGAGDGLKSLGGGDGCGKDLGSETGDKDKGLYKGCDVQAKGGKGSVVTSVRWLRGCGRG
jgi:hypothetical protein